MSLKQFRLDRKSAGAQALEGLWGPLVGDLLYDMAAKTRGRGNHATRVGTGPRSQMSDRGRVMLFNGVDDVWECERSLGINAEAFTIMAWIWLDSTVAGTRATFLAQDDGGLGEWMFRVFDSNIANALLSLYADAANMSVLAGAGSFHALKNQWVHVAVAREVVAADCHLYSNGLYVATDATAGQTLNTAAVMKIGYGNAAGRYWKGMVDDVRYYSRCLSLGEIGHIYNATRYHPYADIALGRIRRHGGVHTGHVRRAAA